MRKVSCCCKKKIKIKLMHFKNHWNYKFTMTFQNPLLFITTIKKINRCVFTRLIPSFHICVSYKGNLSSA